MCLLKNQLLKYHITFGDAKGMRDAFNSLWSMVYLPLLSTCEKYMVLQHYFAALLDQGGIVENAEWAAWVTPFSNARHDPIYCFMKVNTDPEVKQRYSFMAFCLRGEGPGKILESHFQSLPKRPVLYKSLESLHYDASLGTPSIPFDHIAFDRTDRLPKPFVQAIVGTNVAEDSDNYYKDAAEYVKSNPLAFTLFKGAVESAVKSAVNWASQDIFLCVPSYYSRKKCISLLLPLSLASPEKVDCALVVTKNDAGTAYIGQTLLTLSQSYYIASSLGVVSSSWLSR